MKFDDGKPWFRRWMWISVRPITWQGSLVEFFAFVGFLGFGVFARTSDQSPWMNWLFVALALGFAVTFLVIVNRKMKRDP